MSIHQTPAAWPKLGQIDRQLNEIIKENPALVAHSLGDLPGVPAARQQLSAMVSRNPPVNLEGIKKSEIHIPVRDGSHIRAIVYKPEAPLSSDSPLVVLYHGGGWCLGMAELEEPKAAKLVRNRGAVVLSVDYRKVPEKVFPTAITDSWDALVWIVENASKLGAQPSAGLVIGGSSAGSNISAVLSHLARDNNLSPPLTGVYLHVPFTCAPEILAERYGPEYTSYEQNVKAPILDVKAVEFFRRHYAPEAKSELFSPLLWPSGHGALPKTYFQISGLDPLRDDGLIYARELDNAGVEVRVNTYPGVPHSFEGAFSRLDIALKAAQELDIGFKWLLE
ncbi:hypothetical protein FOYG_17458 [Fusarium oxysporum NRRL 32931]|uniref:Alpha/beta hydrolase fold-3 domain-containing protein n=1 Tax=Fusarium oxysporum NRRL 32931 TaxID=660029 RepID=W9HEF6_FUSOX|nr:hypothetical protein FOYG_17458 [Fusarium oxysporum NRRL 32931]